MTGREDRPEWAIRCPWCQAPAGQRCTRPSGGRLSIPSHEHRITAWNAQAARRQTEDPEPNP